MTVVSKLETAQSQVSYGRHSIDPSISHRFLQYAPFTPDIIEAFLDGSAPFTINASRLKTLVDLPLCWEEQQRLFGMGT